MSYGIQEIVWRRRLYSAMSNTKNPPIQIPAYLGSMGDRPLPPTPPSRESRKIISNPQTIPDRSSPPSDVRPLPPAPLAHSPNRNTVNTSLSRGNARGAPATRANRGGPPPRGHPRPNTPGQGGPPRATVPRGARGGPRGAPRNTSASSNVAASEKLDAFRAMEKSAPHPFRNTAPSQLNSPHHPDQVTASPPLRNASSSDLGRKNLSTSLQNHTPPKGVPGCAIALNLPPLASTPSPVTDKVNQQTSKGTPTRTGSNTFLTTVTEAKVGISWWEVAFLVSCVH